MTARRELACRRLRAHAHLALAYAGQACQLGLASAVVERWYAIATACLAKLTVLT